MKKSCAKLSKNELVCMYKEGWCVGLRQEGGWLQEGGGTVRKTLKVGRTPLRTM